MKKQTLLLFSLLFFAGCAERGYIVTSNLETQTVTAERITSIEPDLIDKNDKNKSDDLEKMTKDVKKTLKKQKRKPSKIKKIKKVEKSAKKKAPATQKTIKPVKEIEPKGQKEEVKSTPSVLNNDDLNEGNLLLEAARKSRELRKAKLREAFELKELARKKAEKSKEESSTSEKIEEKPLENTKQEENNAAAQKLKEKIAKDKEKSRLEQIKKAKELKAQQDLEKKRLLEEKKEKTVDTTPSYSSNKKLATTEALKFNPIDKVYQKFGTSEVHGRVIYLNNGGQEVRLGQTKIYLLPVSAKLNHWYTSYYLKNKSNKNNTIVNYLNKTSLNAEKKFEFFGVPVGSYYVIIESNYPSSMGTNKKVYIAKKIKVGKYKKVMGVFSKKL